MKKIQLPFRLPKKPAFIALLLVVVLVGGFTGYKLTRKKPTVAPAPQVVTYSTDTPDEVKPKKESYKWQGAGNDPKYISLPSIATEGFLQTVGIDQKGAIAVPNNIHLAGWFNKYVRPGESGLSIIDGHVDGRENVGIFKNLVNLKQNDNFSVEFGDGSKQNFTVIKVVSVPVAGAEATLFSQEPDIEKQLNLITCGGKFNREKRQYEERVIVIAKAV